MIFDPDMFRLILDDIDPKMVQLANANKRLHWRRKADVTKYWRQLAAFKTRRGTTIQRAHITVTIRWPDARKRDPGNWAPLAKALVDGIVHAGLLPDDDHRHVIGPDLRRDPTNGPLRVVVDVEEVAR